jgi:hypothetical protein
MAGRWRQERPEFPAGTPIWNFSARNSGPSYANPFPATMLHMSPQLNKSSLAERNLYHIVPKFVLFLIF